MKCKISRHLNGIINIFSDLVGQKKFFSSWGNTYFTFLSELGSQSIPIQTYLIILTTINYYWTYCISYKLYQFIKCLLDPRSAKPTPKTWKIWIQGTKFQPWNQNTQSLFVFWSNVSCDERTKIWMWRPHALHTTQLHDSFSKYNLIW
jgi:hypothetical protein